MTNTEKETLRVATEAFAHFEHGLASGQWQPFLDLLSDDFTFWFPLGEFRGRHQGKERAAEFFAYVAGAFPDGLTLTLDRVTSNEQTAVFEFRDWGMLRGAPYENRVALSFDVRDGRICAYREYLGSDGKPG